MINGNQDLDLNGLASNPEAKVKLLLYAHFMLQQEENSKPEQLLQGIQISAELGQIDAQLILGHFYRNGILKNIENCPPIIGVKNIKEACKWYKKVVEQGDSRGLENLQELYDTATGSDKEYIKKALQEFLKAQSEKVSTRSSTLPTASLLQSKINIQTKSAPPENSADEKNGIEQKNSTAKKTIADLIEQAEAGNKIAQYNLAIFYEQQRNYTKAFEWCKKSAEQGHIEAILHLANCYALGLGVDKDEAKSFSLYLGIAENNVDAGFAIAGCYRDGRGIQKNEQQAKEWFIRVARKGHEEAQNWLGENYDYEAKDEDKECITWCKKAAAKGKHKAKIALAHYYPKQSSIPEVEKALAFEYCLLAANEGFSEAQYYIAKNFENKNFKKAINWFKKAALQGHLESQIRLGSYIAMGKPITCQFPTQVLTWVQAAATAGDPKAQVWLGIEYYNIAKDSRMASYWWQKAAQAGDAEAQYNLAMLLATGEGTAKDEKLAVSWYQQSAEKGFAMAQYQLAHHLETGNGIEQDEKAATVWLLKAAEQNYRSAQKRLGIKYARGWNFADEQRALEWCTIAASENDALAEYKLGQSFERKKKWSQMFFWYKKAADHNFEKAYDPVARCYKNGIGVDKVDTKKAEKYYKKAAQATSKIPITPVTSVLNKM